MVEGSPQQTILVIDDEANARKLARMLLEREGYRVLAGADGEEGLILAKAEQPSLILLDVMMPKMNGYEVLKRLKGDTDTKTIPVIMVTARSTDRDIETSFRLGTVFHLEKPYETKDLLQKIRVALVATQQGTEGSADSQT